MASTSSHVENAGMKIFLVDDSEVILAHLRRIVSQIPGTVIVGEAGTQDDAIAGIAASRPDTAVLDLALAHGSGIEVLRRTRPQRPEMKLVILTNKSERQYRDRCLALGADLFLDKTRDFEALARFLATSASGPPLPPA